jgi:hypothetical protein
MISRRHFARGTFAFAISVGSRSARALAPNLPADLARLEAESGGRLGVAAHDSVTGAVYLTQSPQSADQRNAVIASVGRLIAAVL